MVSRDALERRIFRLALLLTGREDGALRVLERVLGDNPDLRSVDGVHLDRMTILRSREVIGGRSVTDDGTMIRGVPRTWSAAFWAMPEQSREAWVLTRVYKTPARTMARSMDCSTTATARHLERADADLHDAMGAGMDAFIDTVLEFSMQADVPPVYRERIVSRRRRRQRLIVIVALIGVVGMAVLVAVMALRQARPEPAPEVLP
jgi:hypothetical protein